MRRWKAINPYLNGWRTSWLNAKPVFIDTNILFYAHDKDAGEKHEKALQAVLRAWSGGVRSVISVQVLQELFVNLCRKLENDSIAAAANCANAEELWTEDLNNGQLYGSVRAANPLVENFSLP